MHRGAPGRARPGPPLNDLLALLDLGNVSATRAEAWQVPGHAISRKCQWEASRRSAYQALTAMYTHEKCLGNGEEVNKACISLRGNCTGTAEVRIFQARCAACPTLVERPHASASVR